jgi:hypothetical protein
LEAPFRTPGTLRAVPAPTPARDREVYFVGAGLSCALGLPNTAMLLDGVLELASESKRWQGEDLEGRLRQAFEYFYPDAVHEGYMPDVVDFFSALRTYLDVGAGLPGGFADAPHLYRALKIAIAHLLIRKLRHCESVLKAGHSYLDEVVQRGNVVVTSNWDVLIEHYADLHGVPVRLSGSGEADELAVLKLHGSLDWCIGAHMKRAGNRTHYARLTERLFPDRPYKQKIPSKSKRQSMVFRSRALESWSSAWRVVSGGATEPHLVTMVRGKAGDLGHLRQVWRDAYGAISRARRLEVVGYSMPPDDIEIRTLLRAGVQRGDDLDEVMVRNPSPDVHVRVRQYLDRHVESDYRGIKLS